MTQVRPSWDSVAGRSEGKVSPGRGRLVDAAVPGHGLVADGGRDAPGPESFLLADGAEGGLGTPWPETLHDTLAPVAKGNAGLGAHLLVS